MKVVRWGIEYREEKRLCSVDTKTTMVFVHVHREGCRTCWKQVGLVSKKKPIHLLELRAIVKSMNESDHENSKIYYDAMYWLCFRKSLIESIKWKRFEEFLSINITWIGKW